MVTYVYDYNLCIVKCAYLRAFKKYKVKKNFRFYLTLHNLNVFLV